MCYCKLWATLDADKNGKVASPGHSSVGLSCDDAYMLIQLKKDLNFSSEL